MFDGYPLNKVALFIPDDLNNEEIEKVFSTLKEMLNNTHFHFSFYRTIQEDFLEFLIKLPDYYYSRFSLHFISSVDYLDEEIVEIIRFLESLGLQIIEHHLPVGFDHIATSSSYEEFVTRIISAADETLSFYKRDDKQISKILRPLDLTKKLNKKSYLFSLDKKGKLTSV